MSDSSSSQSSQPQSSPTTQVQGAWFSFVKEGEVKQVELASPSARFKARVIDFLLIWVGLFFVFVSFIQPLVMAPLKKPSQDLTSQQSIADFHLSIISTFGVFIVVFMIYEIVMVAFKGATFGKMLTRCRIVNADNGLIPGVWKSLKRRILPAGLFYLLFFAVYVPHTINSYMNEGPPESIGSPGSFINELGAHTSYVIVYILMIFALFLMMLCYLSFTWSRSYQGLHDKFAKTVVVAHEA